MPLKIYIPTSLGHPKNLLSPLQWWAVWGRQFSVQSSLFLEAHIVTQEKFVHTDPERSVSVWGSPCYTDQVWPHWEALAVLLQNHACRYRGLLCSCSTSVRSFYSRQSISNFCVRELSEAMKSKWLPSSRDRFLFLFNACVVIIKA